MIYSKSNEVLVTSSLRIAFSEFCFFGLPRTYGDVNLGPWQFTALSVGPLRFRMQQLFLFWSFHNRHSKEKIIGLLSNFKRISLSLWLDQYCQQLRQSETQSKSSNDDGVRTKILWKSFDHLTPVVVFLVKLQLPSELPSI